ncbi:MAG TPA: PKD domain-containing protein [Cyclobacteriaceae bacterium]|nr:PKD domain-containing protein [Cyclobacteriaceae bacterium]
MKYTLVWVMWLIWITAQGQSVNADFSINSGGCTGEKMALVNQSSGALTSSWDFCEADLKVSPQFTDGGVVGLSTALLDVKLRNDKGNWYAFACDGDGNKLTQLSYGASLSNIPVVTKVSDFVVPSGIEIVQLNGTWYGLVGTFTTQSKLYLLTFGSSLSFPPEINEVVLPAGAIMSARSMQLVQEGTDLLLFVSNWNQSKITRINFGSNLSSSISSVDLIEMGTSSLLGITSMEDDIGKYLFVTGYSNNTLYKLSYGNNWKSASPTIEVVTTGSTTLNNPTIINAQYEGGHYYLFSVLNSGRLYRMDFGTDLSGLSPTLDDLGTFGDMVNVRGMDLIRSDGAYVSISTSFSTNKVYRLDFKSVLCDASIPTYEGLTPPMIFFDASGTYPVTLRINGSGLLTDKVSKLTTISSTIAPDIGLGIVNKQCASLPNEYSITSSSAIVSYQWAFGDGGTSSNASPVYTYASSGVYDVNIEVTASNGCKNRSTGSINIFSTPDFTLPTATPVCTNQLFAFSNLTDFVQSSEPAWQWYIDGGLVSTGRDWAQSFMSVSPVTIKLKGSNSECAGETSKVLNVTAHGTSVDFKTMNRCEDTLINFINQSGGVIVSNNWDFGDGNTSTLTDATNTYNSAGDYNVKLTVINDEGCQNSNTKVLTIYSNPQPDFVIEAPPYSCANFPAQFDNNTPPLTDSNITTWAWSFGDAANGTSNQKNPSYTYATASNYNVNLQATTNFGCTASKQKSVTINPSPTAGFTNTPACVNQNTVFTDASSGNITSYQWVVQGTTFIGANPPPYVFKAAGTYPVSLTTTSGIGCKNQIVKNIAVPIPPAMDFTYQPPCTGKPTTFQELYPGGTDPSVAWNWNFGSASGVGSPIDYSFAAPGVYLVTLNTTRNSGCVYSTSKNVTIYNGPVAKFTPSTLGGAPPLTVTCNNESTADSYFWNTGVVTSNEVSPVFTFSELGEYKVLLMASNIHGCIDTTSTKIYVVVPRIDLAMKNFSLIENPSSNSSKPVVTISNLGNIPLTDPEVQIDLGGNAILKEKIVTTVLPGKSIQQTLSLEIVPQTLGYICVEVVPAGDINVYNDRQCLSMTSNDVLFYPYPNPASGQINFDWISSESENVGVTIYKSTGQIAFKQDFQKVPSGINQLAIDISSLSSGLYLIQFSGAKVKKTFSVSVIN